MGSQTDAEGQRRWQIAVTAGAFDAGLRFDGAFDLDMSEVLALLSVGYRVTDDLTLGLRAGAVLDGQLRAGERTWDVRPGGLVSLQAEYRFFADPTDPVTLSGGLAFATSIASTREVGGAGETSSLTAFDGDDWARGPPRRDLRDLRGEFDWVQIFFNDGDSL